MRSLSWMPAFARRVGAIAALLLMPVAALAQAQGPEFKPEAVEALYKTRDKAAIAKMLTILLERPSYGPRDKAAELILQTLGDKDGDLYEPTKKTLLAMKLGDGDGGWQTIRVARILARCDSQRAYRDFCDLLDKAPSPGLKKAIIHALPDLESEDGLKLLFRYLQGGGNDAETALDSVVRLMYPERDHTPQITHRAKRMPSARWAKVQDLAVPLLQKLLKEKVLPGDVQQRALWGQNFIYLVDEAKYYVLPQQFIGIDTNGAPRQKKVPAEMGDWGPEAGFEIDKALRDDIVTGRKMLAEALGRKDQLKPSERAHLLWLQTLYGDPDEALIARVKPEPRPVLFRCGQTNFQPRWEPLADFVKRLDAEPLPTDLSQKPGLEPLYPHHLDEYLKRAAAFVLSQKPREREYGLYCLESRFNWTFGLDADDPAPALARTLQEIKPLLDLMGRGTLVEARGALLVHFGVKLDGPPGKAWLPAVEKAVLSWNPTIRFNAARILSMLRGDTHLMRFATVSPFSREMELKLHLDTGFIYQAENLGKEQAPLPADEALKYRQFLNGDDPETALRAMKVLVAYPQTALAFLRKELKVPPAPDAKRCTLLIADLNSPSFKVRSQATAELKKLGEGVVPYLRRALEKPASLEVSRRLEELLRFHDRGRAGMLRALQVLETLPGPEPRYLLEELAAGPADAALTREAKAALRRVQLYWQW
jgi:HEAT repeat protein